MNLRVLIMAFVIAITALMVSCFCKFTNVPYVFIENILAENCNNKEIPITENSEINSKDFRINLRIAGRLTAMSNRSIPFINRAYATSCDPGEGIRGLKYKVVNFEISSTSDVLGVNSGENLVRSDLVKVYCLWRYKKMEMSVSEWIKNINDNEGFAGYSNSDTPFRYANQSYYFFFNEEFTTDDYVSFTIHIKLDNGQEFNLETSSVKLL